MTDSESSRLTIIAGPCSIDEHNIREIYTISEMETKNRDGKPQRAIAGTRIVGVKSRTELISNGKGMGIDYEIFTKNMQKMLEGASTHELDIPPSAEMSEEVVNRTNMIIALEIMNPLIQLSPLTRIPAKKLMPWNPAVNQLGWPLLEMASFAKKYGWHIGIKNGKWVGEAIHVANSVHYSGQTTMEKTWAGLVTYASGIQGDIVLIHRGVDVPDKGNYRNLPVHQIAARTKLKSGAELYFDPSHSYGPKMKEEIVPAVIEAMKIKLPSGEYLYDGILVEAGTSQTDTEQHITLKELETLVKELSVFRDLVPPNSEDMDYTKVSKHNSKEIKKITNL